MRRVLVLLLLLVPAVPASGQRMGSRPQGPELTLTGRAGFDSQYNKTVVGGTVLVPAPLVRGLAFQVAGDLTFLDNLTERQLALDVVYDMGGVRIGAGPVFRNSYWPDDPSAPLPDGGLQRETRTGYSLVLGLGGMPVRNSPFTVGVEIRFVWVEDFRPRPITLGVGVIPARLFR